MGIQPANGFLQACVLVCLFICLLFNFLREMSGQERFLKTLMFELALKVEESLGRRREGRGMVEMKMG